MQRLPNQENIEKETDEGNTDLHTAILTSQLSTLDRLLSYKKNRLHLKTKNKLGYTPVEYAAAVGKVSVLEYFEKKNLISHSSNEYGETLIHIAAKHGKIQVIMYLLAKGFSPHLKNNHGETPLMVALEENQIVVIKWLTKMRGLRVNISIEQNKNRFKNITGQTFFSILPFLKGKEEDMTQFINTHKDKIIEDAYLSKALKKYFEETINYLFENKKSYEFKWLQYFCFFPEIAATYKLNLLLIAADQHPSFLSLAIQFCYELMRGDLEKWARINLAEIYLRGSFTPFEEGSPLETPDPFLTNKDYQLKRALTAYYLIRDINSDNATQLKKILYRILSNHSCIDSINYTIEDWTEKARKFYSAYLFFKSGRKDEAAQYLIKILLTEIKSLPPTPEDKPTQLESVTSPLFFQPATIPSLATLCQNTLSHHY